MAASRELSTAAYLVLGMVGSGARTGYEIKRAVELSTRYFWNISPAQIYPSLERLEEQGLLKGRQDPRGRRQRRLFAITPGGEEALAEWVADTSDLSLELRDLGWLKLFFGGSASPEGQARLVAALRVRSETALAALEGELDAIVRATTDVQANPFPLEVLRAGIALHEAALERWIALEATLAGPKTQRRRAS